MHHDWSWGRRLLAPRVIDYGPERTREDPLHPTCLSQLMIREKIGRRGEREEEEREGGGEERGQWGYGKGDKLIREETNKRTKIRSERYLCWFSFLSNVALFSKVI